MYIELSSVGPHQYLLLFSLVYGLDDQHLKIGGRQNIKIKIRNIVDRV